jgi:hypothetical protein
MATIRRIVSSGAISDFRQSAPAAGGGFRLLAEGFDALYDRVLPQAISEETAKGAQLGRDLAKQQFGGQQVYGSTMGGHDHSVHAGQTHGEWLKYSNAGAIRNDPLDPKLIDAMSFVSGMGITMDVVSGGQESNKPGEGTGSTRHNHGQSADVDFYKDGRKLDWNNPADLPLLKEIVSTAKSRGVTGIGAGDDYMGPGRFHVGFGAPAVWGAGGKSANAPSWLVEAYNGAPGGPVSKSSSGTPEAAMAFAPTTMRDADGNLVSKLYDPSSDPIKQAFNLAAGADYQSQVFLQSTTDLMGMRQQFALDPDGFMQAAEGYLEGIVEKAPTLFQQDIRAGLAQEVQRSFLGLLDDQHRDIQQRSANSNQALVSRYSDDLASAIAGGDPKEIAGAQEKLSATLAVRERLPGLAWTPEQSANAVADAQQAGQSRIQKQRDDQSAGWKKTISTVIKAARAGLTAADEAILDDPMVQAMFPDEVREAMAFTTLRDQTPSLMRMPPKDQSAALSEMKPEVQEDWEVDLWRAAEKAVADNAKALKEDPIKRLGEIFPEDPPPPMPDLTNPEAIPDWLSARAVYAQRKTDEGFMPKPIYLSNEEAVAMGAAFGKEVPPEIKAEMAGAVVAAMGDGAAGFFKQIKTKDPVIPHVGAMMAKGGDPTVATEAMTGQSLLDQKVVPAPSASAVEKGYSADLQAALGASSAMLPGMEGVRKTAIAIYAARVPANADDEMQANVMTEAWQSALGQTTAVDGETLLGGVQTVGGQPVLMPLGMAGADLEAAMGAAFGFKDMSAMETFGSIWGGAEPDLAIWQAAGGVPVLGGQPLDPSLWDEGEIVLTPMGGTKYMLSVKRGDSLQDAGVQGQDPAMPFIFDAEALIAAAQATK